MWTTGLFCVEQWESESEAKKVLIILDDCQAFKRRKGYLNLNCWHWIELPLSLSLDSGSTPCRQGWHAPTPPSRRLCCVRVFNQISFWQIREEPLNFADNFDNLESIMNKFENCLRYTIFSIFPHLYFFPVSAYFFHFASEITSMQSRESASSGGVDSTFGKKSLKIINPSPPIHPHDTTASGSHQSSIGGGSVGRAKCLKYLE